MFAYLFSEMEQALQKDTTGGFGKGYFSHFSNKMDILVVVLHVVYMVLRWASNSEQSSGMLSAATNVLIIACIFSWIRLTAIFPVSSTLGPLYFILVKIFRDCFLWFGIFLIFAVSFGLGFCSLALQAGASPLEAYGTGSGSFPVSFFAILGEFAYVLPLMADTPIGMALIAIYTMISQVMLVNLLIAMMGDTYATLKENSDIEWKYYRRMFVRENATVSLFPPPTNLLFVPIQFIVRTIQNPCGPRGFDLMIPDNSESVEKMMRANLDKLLERTEKEESNSLNAIAKELKERIRDMYEDREKDREFMEKKLDAMEQVIEQTSKNMQKTMALLEAVLHRKTEAPHA